jgi:hypothetical protein
MLAIRQREYGHFWRPANHSRLASVSHVALSPTDKIVHKAHWRQAKGLGLV